tara:strand:+ start:78 stop:776 length:699 start_codon:yes stop_codon:yes gene_type:complete
MFLLFLFPIVASYQDIGINTFESKILNRLPKDGSHGILTTGNPALINNNLPVFNVIDDSLFRYLGMEEGSVSLISLKDNRTNFDTWLFNETTVETDGSIAFDVNALLETKQTNPQVFEQENKMNKELNLFMDNEAYKGNVNVILFFRDEVKAMALANMIHQQNFINVTYNCWDMLKSDPPIFIDTIPSIGITSKVLQERIPILRYPVNNETLKTFIEANLKEIAIKEARNKT